MTVAAPVGSTDTLPKTRSGVLERLPALNSSKRARARAISAQLAVGVNWAESRTGAVAIVGPEVRTKVSPVKATAVCARTVTVKVQRSDPHALVAVAVTRVGPILKGL